MKQTTFCRCFLTEDRLLGPNGLTHLTEKMAAMAALTHVWIVVNHTPLQRSTRYRTDILISVNPIKTASSVKNVLSKRFSTCFSLTSI